LGSFLKFRRSSQAIITTYRNKLPPRPLTFPIPSSAFLWVQEAKLVVWHSESTKENEKRVLSKSNHERDRKRMFFPGSASLRTLVLSGDGGEWREAKRNAASANYLVWANGRSLGTSLFAKGSRRMQGDTWVWFRELRRCLL